MKFVRKQTRNTPSPRSSSKRRETWCLEHYSRSRDESKTCGTVQNVIENTAFRSFENSRGQQQAPRQEYRIYRGGENLLEYRSSGGAGFVLERARPINWPTSLSLSFSRDRNGRNETAEGKNRMMRQRRGEARGFGSAPRIKA